MRQTPARGPLVRRETPSGEIRTWRSPRQAEIENRLDLDREVAMLR